MHVQTHSYLDLTIRPLTVKIIPFCVLGLPAKLYKWYNAFYCLGQEFSESNDRLNKFSKTQRTHQSMTVLRR